MLSEIIHYLLEEQGEAPEEDFKDLYALKFPNAVNLSDDIWKNDALLRRAFSWLTRAGLAPKFGTLPIAYYQQDQIKALDGINELASKKGLRTNAVRLRNGILMAYKPGSGWVRFARVMIGGHILPLSESENEYYKDLYTPSEEVTLDMMKAAEPGFFEKSPGNKTWFGSSRYYPMGRYLIVRNRRKQPGHFGNTRTINSWVIYEFKRTPDSPNGLLLYIAPAHDLRDARKMIRRQDFRPYFERVREEIAGLGQRRMAESDPEDFVSLPLDDIDED